ncbi:MAG TPA: hypothetical protein VD930_09550 [Gemmatimonadales bacterium]|nr:hypothetical protein [Gemmatimonadales bacterium]
MKLNPDLIAAEWVAYAQRLGPGGDLHDVRDADRDGPDEPEQLLITLLIRNPAGALEVVAAILKLTDDPWVLSYLGAGPIEDLIHDDPGLLQTIMTFQPADRLAVALRDVSTTGLPREIRTVLDRVAWTGRI